ncbi:hypothetical protein GUJ93_ZPchr0006g43588 [Zizania palustris]|uniref:Uncharacterized protein n=1 Tax=Zizania palustris TaxID=103762 RepID=A0A8J5TDN3_ZIZPA|nr:hypothetical protein GUJ93_ZPchr0006g43588 [Zizania palustris]
MDGRGGDGLAQNSEVATAWWFGEGEAWWRLARVAARALHGAARGGTTRATRPGSSDEARALRIGATGEAGAVRMGVSGGWAKSLPTSSSPATAPSRLASAARTPTLAFHHANHRLRLRAQRALQLLPANPPVAVAVELPKPRCELLDRDLPLRQCPVPPERHPPVLLPAHR